MGGLYTSWRAAFQGAKNRGHSTIGYAVARVAESLPDVAIEAIAGSAAHVGRAFLRASRGAERAYLRRAVLRPERLGSHLDETLVRLDRLEIEDEAA
jgi:hypothetical protein